MSVGRAGVGRSVTAVAGKIVLSAYGRVHPSGAQANRGPDDMARHAQGAAAELIPEHPTPSSAEEEARREEMARLVCDLSFVAKAL